VTTANAGVKRESNEPQPRLGLVVGQAPPGPPEKLPLGYQPLDGQPGKRLAKLAGYNSAEALWADFDRVDLIGWCPGPKSRKDYHMWATGYRKHRCDGHRFPLRRGRLAANALLRSGALTRNYRLVILCGRLVATAFQLQGGNHGCVVPWAERSRGIKFLVMPHPSGVSHLWNDDVFWPRAAGFLRAYIKIARSEFDVLKHIKKERGLHDTIEGIQKYTKAIDVTKAALQISRMPRWRIGILKRSKKNKKVKKSSNLHSGQSGTSSKSSSMSKRSLRRTRSKFFTSDQLQSIPS